MKKVLLASSALAATFAVTAPALAADGASWNSFTRFFASNSAGDSDNDVSDFTYDTEIHFKYQATADNGLTYGFKTELELAGDSNNGQFDESYIFLEGDSWGRIELGNQDGVAEDGRLLVAATSGFTFGQLNNSTGGSFQLGDNASVGDGDQGVFVQTATVLNDSSDDTKITYLTPSFGGFTAGISYALGGDDGGLDPSDEGDRNQIETGVAYSGEFDGITLDAGLVGNYREDADGNEDYGTAIGVSAGLAGFTFGVAYSYNELESANGAGNDVEVDTFNTSVSYSFSAITVSAGALYSEADVEGGNDEELTAGTAGISYQIAPGLQASLGGTFGTVEIDNQDDNDFNTVVAGVQVSF